MSRIRINLDALGVCASTLCMIHCLALPLLLTALPLWSLSAVEAHDTSTDSLGPASTQAVSQCTDRECCAAPAMDGDVVAASGHTSCCSTTTDFWIHIGLLATVAPLGIVAWGAGYRHHRRVGVLALGMFGVLLLSGALFFGHHLLGGNGEQVMTVAGSICMVSAHLWNRRQCRCCKTPDAARVVEVESVPSVSVRFPVADGGVS